jgi:hypothetical protein
MYYRPVIAESIYQRHSEAMKRLGRIGKPFGLLGMTPPTVSETDGNLVVGYDVEYAIPGIKAEGIYHLRQEGYNEDHSAIDDNLVIQFRSSNRQLDYALILHQHFPELICAYNAYRANMRYSTYGARYTGGWREENPIYNKLQANASLDMDGRNNIFTLDPSMYWDEVLCQRALGYGRDEVIRRLEGQVPRVIPLKDGVYTVFNDDPNLSYEEFVAINDKFKPILGLI